MQGLSAILVLVVSILWIALSIAVYGALLRRLAQDGGKVRTANFGPADVVLCALLGVWFTFLIASGMNAPPREIRPADLGRGAMLFVMIVILIASFLHFRGVKLGAQFGFAIGMPRGLPRAVGFLLAALPFVGCVTLAMQTLLGPEAEPQEVMQFFRDAVANSDRWAIVTTFALGVIVAPLAEEFIFRGFFYGVLKRYLGAIGGTLFVSVLFAGIHMNLSALPALFVLAICFTIAYEATGSLSVAMAMHATFNCLALTLQFLHTSFTQ